MDNPIGICSASLFCSSCSSYFPTGAICPACKHTRSPLDTPTAPGVAIWRAAIAGNPAAQLTLAPIDGTRVLIVPWGCGTRKEDKRATDGGIALINIADGSVIETKSVGALVEGGAAVSESERVIVVGTAASVVGAGEGNVIALDLHTRQERWRKPIGGAVRGAPVIDDIRAYVAASDGKLYCFDVRKGDLVGRPVPILERPAQIPASPLIVREHGKTTTIVVATYGDTFGRVNGKIVAMDDEGVQHWVQEASGNVRGAPTFAEGKVFVTAFRSNPSIGWLMAFKAQSGAPAWQEPFTIQGGHHPNNLSASPLVHDGIVYVGSLNHRLYALDAATGKVLWEYEVGGGIAPAPVWIEGLVVFGANDGKVYALDPQARAIVWSYTLDAPVLTNPLVWEGVIFVGADNGAIAALAWHLGKYAWAAARLEAAGRCVAAGNFYALAGTFEHDPAQRKAHYESAIKNWCQAGEREWSARLRESIPDESPHHIAREYEEAGKWFEWREPQRAARLIRRAAEWYEQAQDDAAARRCAQMAMRLSRAPSLSLRAINLPREWEAGVEQSVVVELKNHGAAPAQRVHVRFAGNLSHRVWVELESIQPNAEVEVEAPLIATASGDLIVDTRYSDPTRAEWRSSESFALTVHPSRTLEIEGDVGSLLLYEHQLRGKIKVRGDVGMVKVSAEPTRGEIGATMLNEIRGMFQQLLAGQERLAVGLVAVYERLDTNNQQVIQAVFQALDAHQLARAEIETLLAPIQAALTLLCERGVRLDDEPLRRQIEELANVVQSQANVEHKLKLAIPLVPLLVEYEAELALGGHTDLSRLWDQVKARFGKRNT